MYGTFHDKLNAYLILEFVAGGEFYNMLREKNRFNEEHTKFYAACVVQGLGYLHSIGFVYAPHNSLHATPTHCFKQSFNLPPFCPRPLLPLTPHAPPCSYRDLKPENLLLDHLGYLKITDMGFAKVCVCVCGCVWVCICVYACVYMCIYA